MNCIKIIITSLLNRVKISHIKIHTTQTNIFERMRERDLVNDEDEKGNDEEEGDEPYVKISHGRPFRWAFRAPAMASRASLRTLAQPPHVRSSRCARCAMRPDWSVRSVVVFPVFFFSFYFLSLQIQGKNRAALTDLCPSPLFWSFRFYLKFFFLLNS